MCENRRENLLSVRILNIFNINLYITVIRTILIYRFSNLKLIWVPVHRRIVGNEFADNAAVEIQIVFFTEKI